jgi:gamma-glutamylcyclotransferase (GGCT)/AIG2-like uncharacterized protein YtfP
MYLFAYGSLKRGQALHHLLANACFIGAMRTAPRYRLYRCEDYPAMVEDASGLSIEGELFDVDSTTLATLDVVEDVPHTYTRQLVDLIDRSVVAEGYLYRKAITGLAPCGSRWPPR